MPRGKGIYDDEDEPKGGRPGRRTRAAKVAWRHARTRLTSTRAARSPRLDRYWTSRPLRLRRYAARRKSASQAGFVGAAAVNPS
jgi:hypothetical protein